MPVISVKHDFFRFGETLKELEREQLPFAAMLAINQTARGAAGAVTRELPAIFSAKGQPTPFTRRAIGAKGARKSNLRAEIFVKRRQASYLGVEEYGGARGAMAGAPILTPVNVALNAYGNIPRGTVKKLLAQRGKYFLGRVRGVLGVWQRIDKPHGVRLIIALRPHAHWRPKFGFHRRIADQVQATFLPNLEAGLAKAIASSIRR